MIRLALYLYLLLILVVVLDVEQAAHSDANINVMTYQASSNGFLSNSYIIVGEQEVLLLDAQFSKDEALKLENLINSLGKNLSQIIITHPHPDHYYGLEYLSNKYDDTIITGGPRTLDGVKNTFKYWDTLGKQTSNIRKFIYLHEGIRKYEDIDLQYRIFRDGESIENLVIYIPSSNALFVGDIASNGVHMWTGENNIENWLNHIKEIRKLGPISIIYPGHGHPAGPEILYQAEQYLLNFKESISNSKTAEEAIRKMKDLYQSYKMPEILEGSVRAIMWSGDNSQ